MTTYNRLKSIVPADQALASKALEAGLEQIKNIFDTALPVFATAVANLESNTGLDSINSLSGPLPANVTNFYTQTLATGTGPQGLLLLTDLIGIPAGVVTSQFTSTNSTLQEMTNQGDFVALTGSQQVYATMETAITGTWTAEDPMNPGDYYTTIPAGWIGTGVYGPANTASGSIQQAFSNVLNPAMQSVVGVIVATNPAQTNALNTNWNNIAGEIVTEKNNMAAAKVDFANLVANLTPWGLVYNLPSYGLDTVEGGTAYVMQSVANVATQGGQAMISTMREARNQARLGSAGIQTDIIISDQYPEPEANLGVTQYTVAQATNQKII